jgi:hypothetical protein
VVPDAGSGQGNASFEGRAHDQRADYSEAQLTGMQLEELEDAP